LIAVQSETEVKQFRQISIIFSKRNTSNFWHDDLTIIFRSLMCSVSLKSSRVK